MNGDVNLIAENVIQIKSGITINADVSVGNIMRKRYVWNPATCSCESVNYLANIMMIQ